MARPTHPLLTIYRGVSSVLAGIAPLWLAVRARAGKEVWSRRQERYGLDHSDRPTDRLVWCHAASVGESLALLPLVAALLKNNDVSVLVTTGTVTSAKLMAERLPAGAFHRFVPLDHVPWIARFLDHWRPDLILWTESELWPNTLVEIAARRIPAALINGRLSDNAFRGWRKRRDLGRQLLRAFHLVLAQSPEDARRFADLGAQDVRTTGNLKLAAAPLPVDPTSLAAFTTQITGRKIWLAASLHPGEEQIAGEVHRSLKSSHAGLLTVIVPRHPAKAADMGAVLTKSGLRTAVRSRSDAITADTDIYIADTMGELGLFYRACDLVFVGKSLAVGGGQNPAEPALMGCAVVVGPDMSNFRDLTASLCEAEAAVQIGSSSELIAAIDKLLTEPATRQRLGDHARAFMTAHSRALEDSLHHLAPLLAARP